MSPWQDIAPLPLFDQPPEADALNVRRAGDRLFYNCPHCGGEMSQSDEEESITALRDDPACCYCRAEWAGVSFLEWRRLPIKVRRSHKPASEWRAIRASARVPLPDPPPPASKAG